MTVTLQCGAFFNQVMQQSTQVKSSDLEIIFSFRYLFRGPLDPGGADHLSVRGFLYPRGNGALCPPRGEPLLKEVLLPGQKGLLLLSYHLQTKRGPNPGPAPPAAAQPLIDVNQLRTAFGQRML